MLLSRLFGRHHPPAARFAPGMFITLLLLSLVLIQVDLVVGFTAIGVTLLMAVALVESNRERIWTQYKKDYKKARHPKGALHEPKPIYYKLNVLLVWPLIGVLGVTCILAALTLSGL